MSLFTAKLMLPVTPAGRPDGVATGATMIVNSFWSYSPRTVHDHEAAPCAGWWWHGGGGEPGGSGNRAAAWPEPELAAGAPELLTRVDDLAGQAVELGDLLDDQSGVLVRVSALGHGPQALAGTDSHLGCAAAGRAVVGGLSGAGRDQAEHSRDQCSQDRHHDAAATGQAQGKLRLRLRDLRAAGPRAGDLRVGGLRAGGL